MARLVLCLCLAGILLSPARSMAVTCQAPQGTSAVDEYCETIPDAKGDQGAGPGQGGGGGGGAQISNRAVAALAAKGEDGKALARVLGKDPAAVKPLKHRERHADAVRATTPSVPSSNPFTAVTRAVSGNSEIGPPFFLALFAVVLLMLGSAWVGWRRRSS